MKNLTLSIFIFLFASVSFGRECLNPKKLGCNVINTCSSPFYVSDSYKMGSRVYEHFRSLGAAEPTKFIPRGSIVYTPPELYNLKTTNDYRYPVKVLSVPGSDLEQTLENSTYEELNKIAPGVDLKKVDSFDKGYIDRRSLRPAGSYTFFVTENAPLFKTPKGTTLTDKRLTLRTTSDQKYTVNRCCDKSSQDSAKLNCHDFYYFDVIDKDNNVVDYLVNFGLECNILPNLKPIAKSDESTFQQLINLLSEVSEVGKIAGIDSLEIIPSSDQLQGSYIAEIALLKIPLNERQEGPFNSFHYNQDDSSSSDAFLRPTATCAFMQVLKKFGQNCSGAGCEVMFGNMFHMRSWDVHQTHESGSCIDIRFFRKSDDDRSYGLDLSSMRYDRSKTKTFIDILIEAGASNIYMNDTSIINDYSGQANGPIAVPGHDNHLHFCLHNSEKVKKTCQKGF